MQAYFLSQMQREKPSTESKGMQKRFINEIDQSFAEVSKRLPQIKQLLTKLEKEDDYDELNEKTFSQLNQVIKKGKKDISDADASL